MDRNGWNEYSKLVLKELETLAVNIQSLNNEIQELKQEIARMREREDRVEELRIWKDSTLEKYHGYYDYYVDTQTNQTV